MLTSASAEATDWSWLPEAGDSLLSHKIFGHSLLAPAPDGAEPTANKYHQDAHYSRIVQGAASADILSLDNQIYHIQLKYRFKKAPEQFSQEALFSEMISRFGEPTKQDKTSMTWESDEVFFYVSYNDRGATIQLTYQSINKSQIAKARNK
jgi:hypothetical protein